MYLFYIHGGVNDITKHSSRDKHVKGIETANSIMKMTGFCINSKDNIATKVINAEVLFTGFLVKHNLPISASDHVVKLFKAMFPDSGIAGKYGCGRTKTPKWFKNAMQKQSMEEVVSFLQNYLFTIGMDACSDDQNKEVVLFNMLIIRKIK